MEEGSVCLGMMSSNLLPIPAELDTITGAFSLRNGKGENSMSTRISKNLPQRTDADTSQAGCRGFESRPPLQESYTTARKMARTGSNPQSSLNECARNVLRIPMLSFSASFPSSVGGVPAKRSCCQPFRLSDSQGPEP